MVHVSIQAWLCEPYRDICVDIASVVFTSARAATMVSYNSPVRPSPEDPQIMFEPAENSRPSCCQASVWNPTCTTH